MPVRETVTLDTKNAERALKGLSNAWRDSEKSATSAGKAQEKVTKGSKDLGETLDGVGQSLGNFNKLLGVGGLVLVAQQAAQKLDELVTQGIEMQSVFGNLAIPIDKAREATRGLVDDMTLAKAANTAVRLGVVESEGDFAKLTEAATKLGLSTGQDAAKSVEDLTTALARGSPRILDNLGITLKQEEAQRLYADRLRKSVDALTDAEKAEAFRVIALEKALEASKSVNITLDDGLVRWEELKNELQVLGKETIPLVATAAGAVVEQFEPMVGLLTESAKAGNTLRGELQKTNDTLEEHSTLWQRVTEAWEESPIHLNPLTTLVEIHRRGLEDANRDLEAYLGTEDEVSRSSPAFVNAFERRAEAVQGFIAKLQAMQALEGVGGTAGGFIATSTAAKGQDALQGALGGALAGAAGQAAKQANRNMQARRGGRSKRDEGPADFDEHFNSQVRNAREVSLLTADPGLEADAHADAISRKIEAEREFNAEIGELTESRIEFLDREIERQNALGEDTEFLYERRMQLAIEAAEEDGRIDEAAELRHEREINRIERSKKKLEEERKVAEKSAKDRIKFRRDLESVIGSTTSNIVQLTEAAARASGKSAEEVATATTVARGIETLARAALEQVEAIAAFARYDFLAGAAHQVAAVTGFALGGMMLAGQVPSGGQGSGGARSAGASGGGGGSRAERDVQERPEFPTSPQEQVAQEPQNQGGGGRPVVIQGVINEQVLFEAVHNLDDQERLTGTS